MEKEHRSSMHQVSDLARIGYPASTRPDPTSRWLLPRSVEGRSLHVVGGTVEGRTWIHDNDFKNWKCH